MPQVEYNEEALIRAAQQRDMRAFEVLVRTYERRIYNFVYRMAPRREDAEDITQDIFVKVFRFIHSFKIGASFKAWLYTIATNTVIDQLRKKKLEIVQLDEAFMSLNETIVKEDTSLIIERQASMEQALTKLKPIQRSVILLYYFEEFSYEEIAKILSVPLNTVKTHLYRAKQALRELLVKE